MHRSGGTCSVESKHIDTVIAHPLACVCATQGLNTITLVGPAALLRQVLPRAAPILHFRGAPARGGGRRPTMVSAAGQSRALELLKQYWGFDSFRGDQERVVDAVLGGQARSLAPLFTRSLDFAISRCPSPTDVARTAGRPRRLGDGLWQKPHLPAAPAYMRALLHRHLAPHQPDAGPGMAARERGKAHTRSRSPPPR